MNSIHSFINYLPLVFGALILGCIPRSETSLIVENSNAFDVQNGAVSIPLSDLSLPDYFLVMDTEGNEIPYQLDDLDQDGTTEVLFLQLSVAANSTKLISIREAEKAPVYPQKTDAVFKIRNEADPENMQVGEDFVSVNSYSESVDLQQDNGLIFLEGPGWESDLIGYRFYFDDRNRFDIFGKSTYDPALASITEEYHTRRDWGADVLKVSSTLGIGTPALFKNRTFHAIEKTGLKTLDIIADGPLRSIIRVEYPGWEVENTMMNAELELEIHANHRYTEVRLATNTGDTQFATGLVMHPNINDIVILQNSNDLYSTGFTWGNQTDLDEELGMGIVIPNTLNPVYEGEIQDTYTFSMNSENSSISYLFMAAWEFEPEATNLGGESGFRAYLTQVAEQWISPLKVTTEQ
ncbi:MAG: DUF4861 domain-containing protein [Balneolales bacterium]|nr:DUF4861 domain-containing protein [Balneolales bacterium]